MLVRLDAGDHRRNFPFGVNHERGALDSHVFAPVKTLFFEHAKLVCHALVLIRQQGIGEIEFLLELLLRRRFIAGDTQHHRAGSLDFLECVAEPARFKRSTGRVRFGIEEQHQVLAAKILERDFLTIFIGKGEVRRFIINLHRVSYLRFQ